MCDKNDVKMDDSGRTALSSDSGAIKEDEQFEETVDVSEGEV